MKSIRIKIQNVPLNKISDSGFENLHGYYGSMLKKDIDS